MINFLMEFGRSKNCFGIMKDNKKTVNKNLGIIKFCDLSGHAKYVHKSIIFLACPLRLQNVY